MCDFSIIMPAYNEEESLEMAILATRQTFQTLNLNFEFIIVNDGSTDKTGTIADALTKKYSDVSCLHHPYNQGAGAAFRHGIEAAVKSYVIFVPCDNPLDPEDVQAYLSQIKDHDIVVGCRQERVGYAPLTAWASGIYNNLLIPLLFNLKIADVNWIQVYRRDIFTSGLIKFYNPRIFFFAEILIQARRKNLRIAEVSVKMKKRLYKKATNARFSTMWGTFRDTVQFYLKNRTK